jgi:hypothetical protein
MKPALLVIVMMMLMAVPAAAQVADTTMVKDTTAAVQSEPAPVQTKEPSKVFYGGTVGFTFGDYFRISVQPMVGYSFSPKLSGGVKATYEYINDSRGNTDVTWHNFGGSVFGRYRFIPQAYLHAEFAYMSYEFSLPNGDSDRDWVPFLLLGGGIVQPVGGNASVFVEVLFDVLQDNGSPYEDWTPFVSAGVAVGF